MATETMKPIPESILKKLVDEGIKRGFGVNVDEEEKELTYTTNQPILYRESLRNRFFFKHGNAAWGFLMGYDVGIQTAEKKAEEEMAKREKELSEKIKNHVCVYIWSSGTLWNVSDTNVQKVKHQSLPAYKMEDAIRVARELFGKDVAFKIMT